MPQEVINRVHVLARRSHAALTFADRDGIVIPDEDDDDDNDGDYEPDEPDPESEDEETTASDSDNDNDDDDAHANDAAPIDPDYDIAGVFDGNADDNDNPNGDNTNEPAVVEPNEPETNDGEPTIYQIELNDADPTENGPVPEIPVIDAITIANEELAPAEINAEDAPPDVEDEQQVPPQDEVRPGIQRYNLRAQRPRHYSHLHTTLEDTVMTQFSMKRGIKEFGEARVDAVLAELQQLHDRQVLEPRQPETMTGEEK